MKSWGLFLTCSPNPSQGKSMAFLTHFFGQSTKEKKSKFSRLQKYSYGEIPQNPSCRGILPPYQTCTDQQFRYFAGGSMWGAHPFPEWSYHYPQWWYEDQWFSSDTLTFASQSKKNKISATPTWAAEPFSFDWLIDWLCILDVTR